ncbi:MAG: hypothetical protein WCE48_03935 [Steroidobacteraceae bacterium]
MPSAAGPTLVASPAMDLEFIEKNQIVEKYLSGRLPPRGASDFERFCRENPHLLDQLGLPARVNRGVQLLEASGKPEPWQEPKLKYWQQPLPLIATGVIAVGLLVTTGILASKLDGRDQRIAALGRQIAEQPLEPVTETRSVRVMPSRTGPTRSAAVSVGGSHGQLADLKFDLAWARYSQYRVTIDREDQGRVAVLQNVAPNSNGELRIAFNTSAFGPGLYRFSIDGLNWQGQPEPAAWSAVEIHH